MPLENSAKAVNAHDFSQRLSRISTMWTVHRAAFQDGVSAKHLELLQRYRGPAFRYLLACVKSDDVAEDLAQDFALKFLRGDFGRADPERGRFRDYLRTSLSRLATDHFRRRKKEAGELAVEPADPQSFDAADREYDEQWRCEALDRAWAAIAKASPTEYAALKLRVEEPDLTSGAMAERLGAALGREINADAVRKALERGRRRFADSLVAEVEATLESKVAESLERELTDLGLIRYCRTALESRRRGGD